jgi:hypothetical protein
MNEGPGFRAPCDDGGGCVEVAAVKLVAVRDSKDPDGPKLIFGPGQWAAFTSRVRAGEFRLR